jgi:aromatic ring hydroxylase
MAQALGKRQLAGTWLAHPTCMTPELTDEFRELLECFAELPAEERVRILSLVRNLSICHALESAWKSGFYRSGIRSTSEPVCDPCV